ncbi:trehalase-like domain-containing protein [Streptomyces griseoluteus]|uniref:trehalase-like domain-containing protein n=1 Tax=Streptomyces griseoluteus TaxID=29306 RepID=UPI0036807951
MGQIEDHAFIGNMHTGALVDRDGAITMLSPGRFDAPAAFARLLGTEEHDLWQVGPAVDGPVRIAVDLGYSRPSTRAELAFQDVPASTL